MSSNPVQYHGIDFADLTSNQRYKILIGSIVPRPIAWITTVDSEGNVNAAPFSFFNALSADPPLVGFGIQRKSNGIPKDTLNNILQTGVFTINIVSNELTEAMSVCAINFPETSNEIEAAQLNATEGSFVCSPRIAEAPISLECKQTMIIPTGPQGDIVLGEVLFAHVRSDLCDPHTLHIDPHKLDAVGRMGGQGYSLTREYFDLSVKTFDEWKVEVNESKRIWKK